MTRKVPHSEDIIAVTVLAPNGHLASMLADEVAYAISWHRGAYKGQKRKAPKPEIWAIRATSPTGVHAQITHAKT